MSFDWSEYLNLAQELAGRAMSPPSEEAKFRSAVSRAYYAAFCKARNHLRDREMHSIPSTGEAHRYVITTFRKSAHKPRRQIGENLNRLRIDRTKADYDDSVTGLSPTTSMDLQIAEEVLSALSRLR